MVAAAAWSGGEAGGAAGPAARWSGAARRADGGEGRRGSPVGRRRASSKFLFLFFCAFFKKSFLPEFLGFWMHFFSLEFFVLDVQIFF